MTELSDLPVVPAVATSGANITLPRYVIGADSPTMDLLLIPHLTETIEQKRGRVDAADAAAWADFAGRFGDRLRDLDPEAKLWMASGDNVLTLVTPRDDLDHELALHAVFVDLSRGLPPAAIGALVVRTVDEAPAGMDFGERLI